MTNLMHKFLIHLLTILYMYTFRALSCSFSGGQIVLIQHLVSSLKEATLANDQLDAQIFNTFINNPLRVHVSSSILLILRRTNCINTASGIVTLSK
jgi:hypothetical protein